MNDASADASPGDWRDPIEHTRRTLLPLCDRDPVALQAVERIDRDLLPRCSSADQALVCGIVGPNNAGKSALFNALVGHPLSPSSPTGGATRRLLGAAAPALVDRLADAPGLARFALRRVEAGAAPIADALETATSPSELLIVAEPSLPETLMLIDTPDFDSILHHNREASEALLSVADVVIVVVTRHSYQNREVVEFLESWLANQRPWMLVYNEAADEETARAHTDKLVARLGERPLGMFWAPHALEIQEGTQPLLPRRLAADGGAELRGAAPGTDLRRALLDLEGVREVKARAFAAGRARLCTLLGELADSLAADAARARDLLEAARLRTAETGRRVASTAMPAGPFVEAFRIVLDRRSNLLSRGWRTVLRGLRGQAESLAGALFGRGGESVREIERRSLSEVETTQIRAAWPGLWEDLARDLGPEARHPARRACGTEIAAALDADLAEPRRTAALADAEAAMREGAEDLNRFREACETLVDQAIEERGFDLDIQAAADLATLAPLALAAVVVVNTGGFGFDLAIAGGGAASSFLLDKYSHLLGSGILMTARRRWAEMRGEHLTSILLAAALPLAAERLATHGREDERAAAELRARQRSLQ